MSETSANIPVVMVQPSGRRLSAGRIATAVLVVLIVVVGVGAALLYASEERSIAESRQASAALAGQLAQVQQEVRDRQADLDSTRQQLAQSQSATADAQANGKILADQLAQAQQQTQQAEAQAKGLQGDNDSLRGRLMMSDLAVQDAQSKNATLGRKMSGALARAQLLDEFYQISTSKASSSEKTKMIVRWLTNLGALNDAMVSGYLQEFMTTGKTESLNQILTYLSGSVVAELQ